MGRDRHRWRTHADTEVAGIARQTGVVVRYDTVLHQTPDMNVIPASICVVATLLAIDKAAGRAHQPPKVEADSYAWEQPENPFTGDADAIAEGQRLYRSICYICHADTGARGPNLRKSKLKDQAFLKAVINGRKGSQMPAWRSKLSETEMWKIYSFIEAPLP